MLHSDPYQQLVISLSKPASLQFWQARDGQLLQEYRLSEQELVDWQWLDDQRLALLTATELQLWQMEYNWVQLNQGVRLLPRANLLWQQSLPADFVYHESQWSLWAATEQQHLAWLDQGQVRLVSRQQGEWQQQLLPLAQQQALLWHPNRPWLLLADHQAQVQTWGPSAEGWQAVGPAQQLAHGPIAHWFWLAGSGSLMLVDEQQHSRWLLSLSAQAEQGLWQLAEQRTLPSEVHRVQAERDRRGYVLQHGPQLHWYYPSARSSIGQWAMPDNVQLWHLAGQNDRLWLLDDQLQLQSWQVANPHPELSWAALWLPQWYEGRAQADWLWQASASSDQFEPKFSLLPLTLGTFKAAFYGLIIAIPLAILSALYCAQFLPPASRAWIKPSVEMMEALPTVILGFLAGLWLAPLLQLHLLMLLLFLLLLPTGLLLLLLFAGRSVRLTALLNAWPLLAMCALLLALLLASMLLAGRVEQLAFGGDLILWLNERGWAVEQRNALVVGLAMGFALTPTIFSMAEDAIFSVPARLAESGMALGLSRWQAMIHLVLPMASPGIFSAVMLGLGRALGETMILIMATGNNAILDFSPLTGMRTVSASLAIELPEAVPGSSHYRVLLLAALLLIVLTMMFNSLAELVRQRLKQRYSGWQQ